LKIVGLTGGSGAGKGTVGALLRSLGCRIIDTDALYHKMIDADSECSRAIVDHFGKEIRNEKGGVDRRVLADIVFGSTEKLDELNTIAHSFVRAECDSIIERERNNGTEILVIDAPQLFEAGMECICDHTLAVISDKNARINRICKRDSISSFKACARMAAQHTDAYFCDKCDFVIENNSDIARLLSKVKGVLDKIKE
jgi:dephospho-CoA kinase